MVLQITTLYNHAENTTLRQTGYNTTSGSTFVSREQESTSTMGLTHPNWTGVDWGKNMAWLDECGFLLQPSFGINSMKPWTQPTLYQQFRHCVGDVFLAHIVLLNTNQAVFECYRLSKYCY